jgi:hypothetical protein
VPSNSFTTASFPALFQLAPLKSTINGFLRLRYAGTKLCSELVLYVAATSEDELKNVPVPPDLPSDFKGSKDSKSPRLA